MQNMYKKLLTEVLLLELHIFRTPKRKNPPAGEAGKNPFRWIIVDSYTKQHGNGIYNHAATRLWER